MRLDLRYAFRALRQSPLFTFVAIASLALGIGANTAIFSLMDQLLWRSLPVKDPKSLYVLTMPGPNQGMVFNENAYSYPMYRQLAGTNSVFSGLIARFASPVNLTVGDEATRVTAEIVSGNYFDVLGVGMALGRSFAPEEDRVPNAHPVAVLSHAAWRERFGGSPQVIGAKILINSKPFTVIGVAAAGFRSVHVGQAPEVFLPIQMKRVVTPDWDGLSEPRVLWLSVFGRLKPGMTPSRAEEGLNIALRPILEAELGTVRMSQDQRKRFANKRVTLLPGYNGTSYLRERFESPLRVLLAMVAALLILTCVNVSGLQLARAVTRQKEIAVRLAIGAGKWQVARQLFTENFVLALAGGAAALLVAAWAGSLLVRFLPDPEVAASLSREFDPRMFLFTLALSVGCGLLFGLAPAIQAIRPDLAPRLKEEGRLGSAARGTLRVRKALVGAQVALSLLLLLGAGLFARSLSNLKSFDPGFRTRNLYTFSIDPSLSGYDMQASRELERHVAARLERIAGVESVSTGNYVPLSGGGWTFTLRVEGHPRQEGENMNVGVDFVGPDYLRTLKVPILNGREFSKEDIELKRNVVVVNRKFAEYFFGNKNPIGRRLALPSETSPWREIIGVAENFSVQSIRATRDRMVFFPSFCEQASPSAAFFVRAATDGNWPELFRQTVRSLDPRIPVTDLKTMSVQFDESIYIDRMFAALAGFFGIVATLLAAIGLHGVVAYTVLQRTREIGIRLALGAPSGTILRLVMRDVLILAAGGLAAGLPLALVLAGYLRAMLFGIEPLDAPVLAATVAALGGVAAIAGLIPATRAMRIEPVQALRYE